MDVLKSARELLEIAGSTVSKVLPDETAESLPVATKSGTAIQMVILYYDESMIPGKEIVYPPHHIIVIDTSSGKIIRFDSCTPSKLGVDKPADIPEEGFGLDPKLSADDFWKKRDRFLELSPIVWKLFKLNPAKSDSKAIQIIREYYSIFKEIAKKPLIPYYHAVARDFFKWLDLMTK